MSTHRKTTERPLPGDTDVPTPKAGSGAPPASRAAARLRHLVSRWAAPTLTAWLLFAAYVLAARIPRNFFPLSIFDMYSAPAGATSSRYLFLDAEGGRVRLTAVEAIECAPERPDLAALALGCGPEFNPYAYVVRDQQHLVDEHLGIVPAGEPLRIVGRTYSLEEGARAPRDCEVAVCRMRRR